MEKKIWVTPTAMVEQYAAQHDYAAGSVICFAISCILGVLGGDREWGWWDSFIPSWKGGQMDLINEQDAAGLGTYHTCDPDDGTGCGHAENQYIQLHNGDDNDASNDYYTMAELNTKNDGDRLDCILWDGTSDLNYKNADGSINLNVFTQDANNDGVRDGWSQVSNIGGQNIWKNLSAGQLVYWQTNIRWGNGTTPMYHVGEVQNLDPTTNNRTS